MAMVLLFGLLTSLFLNMLVVPALYLAACAGMAAGAILEQPRASLAALGILAAGIPVFYWRARSSS